MENAFFVEFPTMEIEDLHINNFGHSVTKPCHKFGPAVRSFYLVHYILNGQGEFFVNGNYYKLSKGQGFLIEPDYQTVYMSDSTNPWTYVWVGFSGKKAKEMLNGIGICQDFPIFSCEEDLHPEKYVIDMLQHNSASSDDQYRQMAMLYLFFSCLAKANTDKEHLAPNENLYVTHAIRYIQNHYSESEHPVQTTHRPVPNKIPADIPPYQSCASTLHDTALHCQHRLLLRISGARSLLQSIPAAVRNFSQ